MRVLFADAIDPSTVGRTDGARPRLRLGAEAHQPTTFRTGSPGFQALVVRSTKVTAATIEAADALELIVRAGAGTNTIDVEAASEVGIYVTNVPGRNAIAVAELTMGLLLAIDRRIPDNVADLRAGDVEQVHLREGGRPVREGHGHRRARRDRVRGRRTRGRVRHGPPGDPQGSGRGGRRADQGARASSSSTRSRSSWRPRTSSRSTCPASPETESMFDARLLGAMKEGAILLNTSRGNVVDEDALLDALETRELRAGLDVYPGRARIGLRIVVLAARATSPRRRDASHRGVDGPGSEGGGRRGRRDHRGVRPRRDPQLREPGPHTARDPHPPRAPLRPRRRARGRLRHPSSPRPERRADGEPRLRGSERGRRHDRRRGRRRARI